MTPTHKGPGGARPGAGRKPVYRNPVKLVVTMEQEDHDKVRAAAEAAGMTMSQWAARRVLARLG